VLEAGGGSYSHIRVSGETRVTVLDISAEQLARNSYADEHILGDLEEYEFERARFDLVVCYDVLEHLNQPGRALENMAHALRPGGLLVIGCPNRNALKGFVTRWTPHAFHVWYYRHMRGDSNAGRPGRPPFPAPMKPEMGVGALIKAAETLDLEIVSLQHYTCSIVEELSAHYPDFHALYAPIARLVGWLAGQGEARENTDIVLVARRRGAVRASAETNVRRQTSASNALAG
jgi:SAM-dependent methyltransferase